MALQHFLLIFNLRSEMLEKVTPFGSDVDAATRAYTEIEQEYRDRPDHQDYEIVLIGADSLETVQVTHSRYFNGGQRLPSMSDETAAAHEGWLMFHYPSRYRAQK